MKFFGQEFVGYLELLSEMLIFYFWRNFTKSTKKLAEVNELPKMSLSIDAFINKIKTRDIRVPAIKDFSPNSVPKDTEALVLLLA